MTLKTTKRFEEKMVARFSAAQAQNDAYVDYWGRARANDALQDHSPGMRDSIIKALALDSLQHGVKQIRDEAGI